MIFSGLETKKVEGLWLEKIGNRQTLSHYYQLRGVIYKEDKNIRKFKKIIAELFTNRQLGDFTIVSDSKSDDMTFRVSLKNPHRFILNSPEKQAQLYHLLNHIGKRINYYLLVKETEKKVPNKVEFNKKFIQQSLNMIKFTRP